MNKEQYNLLQTFDEGKLNLDDLDRIFEEKFNIDLYSDINFLEIEMKAALANNEEETIELLMNILWIIRPKKKKINILHQLLLAPNHRHYQAVTKEIQSIADPSSVDYIKRI